MNNVRTFMSQQCLYTIMRQTFEVDGVEAVEKEAKRQGNGAHIIVPKSWRGATVKAIRLNASACDLCGGRSTELNDWVWIEDGGGAYFDVCQDCIYRLAGYDGDKCGICHQENASKKSDGIQPVGSQWRVHACDECRDPTLGAGDASDRIAWNPDEKRG